MSYGLRKAIVTGLGTGYLPVAPGTWGSAAVCGIFLAVSLLGPGGEVGVTGAMLTVALSASAGCVALGRWTEEHFGRKDPTQCTADEWAGQAIALCAMPAGHSVAGRLIVTAVAFVAFRALDIVKPPPARRLERLPHGWGVLLDDLVAGMYANAAAQIVLRGWVFNSGIGP